MFLRPPVLTLVPRSDLFRLHEPLVWFTEGDSIIIPAGFITDLASVPRIAQAVIPKTGPYAAAAILHDYLFVTQTHSYAAANRLFLDAMTACGVRWTQRNLIWLAVTVGGWPAWRANARARAADLPAFLARHGLSKEEGTA
jgi:hypothetical protein